MRKDSIWTEQRVKRLRELRAAGIGVIACADEMGISATSIKDQLVRLGMPARASYNGRPSKPSDPGRDRRFAQAWRDGVSLVDLAERFGVSPSHVTPWAVKMGLRMRGAGFDR